MSKSAAPMWAQGPTVRNTLAWLVAAVLAGWVIPSAFAQAPQEPQSKPGVFESIGRWFEQGFSNFKNSIGGAKTNIDELGGKAANAGKDIGEKAAQAGKNAADAAKDAADAVKKLPSTRVVQGHERCETSPNGAPDCRAAALSICQAKGFAEGRSVDFVSAEKCPPAVWMNRRKAEPGECVTETFVTRAMCQ